MTRVKNNSNIYVIDYYGQGRADDKQNQCIWERWDGHISIQNTGEAITITNDHREVLIIKCILDES